MSTPPDCRRRKNTRDAQVRRTSSNRENDLEDKMNDMQLGGKTTHNRRLRKGEENLTIENLKLNANKTCILKENGPKSIKIIKKILKSFTSIPFGGPIGIMVMES